MADEIRSADSLRARLPRVKWLQVLVGALSYAAIWWVLAGGEPRSWVVGVPVVLLAIASGFALAGAPWTRWSLVGVLRVLPYFLWESLRGGANAAVLVFTRPRGIRPVVIEYRTALPAGVPRALMAGVASLLPGTLAVDLQDDRMRIHVLDAEIPAQEELGRLERRIAAMLA